MDRSMFDPMAEASELPNHSPRALSFGLLVTAYRLDTLTERLTELRLSIINLRQLEPAEQVGCMAHRAFSAR